MFAMSFSKLITDVVRVAKSLGLWFVIQYLSKNSLRSDAMRSVARHSSAHCDCSVTGRLPSVGRSWSDLEDSRPWGRLSAVRAVMQVHQAAQPKDRRDWDRWRPIR